MNEELQIVDIEVSNLARSDAQRALEEDVGSGDLTARLVDPDMMARARVVVREPAVLCGAAWFESTVLELDPLAQLYWQAADGQRLVAGQEVVLIESDARALLTAERTALNFLQLLSAVATSTSRYVEAVKGTNATIVDTRKTLPGLRAAQKYAVRAGGGTNHRMGLFDAILIKENHIAAAGSISLALEAAYKASQGAEFVQIEVETLTQLREALDAGAAMILLDNMDLQAMREAVLLNGALGRGRAILEVSGGVRLNTVREVAMVGVDRISVGALTKDIKAVDFSMRIEGLK